MAVFTVVLRVATVVLRVATVVRLVGRCYASSTVLFSASAAHAAGLNWRQGAWAGYLNNSNDKAAAAGNDLV